MGMTLYDLSEEAQEESPLAFTLGEQAPDLFDDCNILISQDQHLAYGIADPDDGHVLVAAIVVGGDDPSAWWSFSVVVDEHYRRRGFARALIEALMRDARRDGLALGCLVVNPEAMDPLLEALGFSREGSDGLWAL